MRQKENCFSSPQVVIKKTERCTTFSEQRAPGPQLPAIVPAGKTCTVRSDSAVITLKPGMTCHSALSVEFAHPGSVASLPRMPKSPVLPKYCFSALEVHVSQYMCRHCESVQLILSPMKSTSIGAKR